MRFFFALIAAISAAAQTLPSLRIEPTNGGSILYVKNTAKAPLLAYLIELVDYPGSYYALWQDDTLTGPLEPGAERKIPITNMTVGAVPDYVKMRAALYWDGTTAGIPERAAQLVLRHAALLDTTRELIHRIQKGATAADLKQWADSLQSQGRQTRYAQEPLNQAAARPLIAAAAAAPDLPALRAHEKLLATRVRNDKVAVVDTVLHPGETAHAEHPAIAVNPSDGNVAFTSTAIRNTGTADQHLILTEFLTPGAHETWGATGLAPNYKVVLENDLARVYEIRIPAGTKEPQHTHHNRVVVCLSGAIIKHLMPDGREEESTLKTGEIVFRPGGTHIGQNLGQTDLWVIAIEPK